MNYISNYWNVNEQYNGNVGRFYAMYGVMKAARLATPEIETFGTYDWYTLYSTWITNNQLADGSWNDTDPWIGTYLGPHMRTSMAVLIMTTAVLTEPPVASFTITPNPADIGTSITFDASASYDPNERPLTYNWNFGDGTTAEGMIVTHQYETRQFSVVLTVTNNAIPPVCGIATQTIYITPPNHPPVAVPGGPYFGWIGPVTKPPVTLDGSNSWDPNEPLDSITQYEWELDGIYPHDFDEGNTPIVQYAWAEAGTHDVALRVTDDPEAPFDNAGLSNTAWTTVEIVLDDTPPIGRVGHLP